MCLELQSQVNRRTSISIFGVPLVIYPLLALAFSVLFPWIDNAPMPPAHYYRDGCFSVVASMIVFVLARPLRDLDSFDVAE